MTHPRLILASASPRRAQLLAQIGAEFEVCAQDIDESQHSGESPASYVQRMADEKAAAAWASLSDSGGRVVIASDTTVVCAGQVLGKPVDEKDGSTMLQLLAGREHEVMTAVTISDGSKQLRDLTISQVVFRDIGEDEARAYWQTGEPQGKAGGYAIQGLGAVFVAGLRGSYSAVMGLPLFETARLLAEFNVPVWCSVAGEIS